VTKDIDVIEHSGNGQLEAATTEDTSFTTIFQAIVAQGTGYTKKSVDTRLAFVEKTARRQVVRHRDSDPVGICQDVVRRLRRAGV
jgi:hypothetical protein